MSISTAIIEVTIEDYLDSILVQRIAKLNKALAKNGQPEAVIVDKKATTITREIFYVTRRLPATVYSIQAPALVHNGRAVSFVGKVCVDPQTGQKKIFNNGKHPFVLGGIDHSKLTCDHCGKKIARSSWNFFAEEGELLHIGSTCAKNYFGIDPSAILAFYETLDELSDEDGEGFESARRPNFTPFEEFVALLWLASKKLQQWVGKEKADPVNGLVSTMGAFASWRYPSLNLSDEERDAHLAAIQKAKEETALLLDEIRALILSAPAPRSDFDWNIHEALLVNGQVREFIQLHGPAAYGIYSLWNKAHAPVETTAKLNEHFGEVGKRVTLSGLKAVFLKWISGPYGDTLLVTFEDVEGRTFKTFYSGQQEFTLGETYTLKGTIKSHGAYQGKKETILSRVAQVAG